MVAGTNGSAHPTIMQLGVDAMEGGVPGIDAGISAAREPTTPTRYFWGSSVIEVFIRQSSVSIQGPPPLANRRFLSSSSGAIPWSRCSFDDAFAQMRALS